MTKVDLLTSHSFRFLLHMYTCLGEGDQTLAERGLCDYLRERIYKVCSGHLEWSFNVAKSQNGKWSRANRISGEEGFSNPGDWCVGVVHVLKLHEHLKVFPNERPSILRYVATRVGPWLNSLKAERDMNSNLWPSGEKSVQVNWHNIEYRSDEWVRLPKYYLEDHIDLWKALSSIQRILEESLDFQQDPQDDIFISDALEKLHSVRTELKTTFAPGALKDLIIERFTYIRNPSHGSKGGADAFILSSRCAKSDGPRIQIYHSDNTTLEDFNDGFFDDADGKPSQAWTETLASQYIKRPNKAWRTSTWLSSMQLMARYGGLYLNETYRKGLKSENPIEQIHSLVASSGMILDCDDVNVLDIPFEQTQDPLDHSIVVWVLISTSDWKSQQSQKTR